MQCMSYLYIRGHVLFCPSLLPVNSQTENCSIRINPGGGGGVLLEILHRGVPPGSPNPDPISDQNMPFSTPFFRPGL